MGRSHAPLLVLLALLTACSGSSSGSSSGASSGPSSDPPSSTPAAATPPYSTVSFQPALTVEPPSWLPPEPSADEPHFLTWTGTGADVDRAVRFLSPIGVYDPAHPKKLGPVPTDFARYVEGLAAYGADISAPTTTTVDGHPATVFTASTSTALSGSLGCPERDPDPEDCYGIQVFAQMHLAVIDVDGTVVLAWARVVPGSPDAEHDFTAFDGLLGTVTFR
jgi:hypothetical protein